MASRFVRRASAGGHDAEDRPRAHHRRRRQRKPAAVGDYAKAVSHRGRLARVECTNGFEGTRADGEVEGMSIDEDFQNLRGVKEPEIEEAKSEGAEERRGRRTKEPKGEGAKERN